MKKLWEILKKFWSIAWKTIGIVAVIAGFVSFYYQFFSAPSILSQVTSETNVLDVHQPVANLQVLFQGNNIEETGKNLKIYRIGFTNNGTTNITQNDFDQNQNWGILLEQGSVIEARVVATNSDYLKNNINPQIIENGSLVKFDKILFDKGASFTVELVVLYDKNILPTLYRVGKIAGVDETGSQISSFRTEEPFVAALLSGSFHGDWKVNLTRFLLYFVVSVALFIVIIILIAKWQETRARAKQAPQPPQQPSPVDYLSK